MAGVRLEPRRVRAAQVQDKPHSSAIRGEQLDAQQVRSFLAARPGLETAGFPERGRRAEGPANWHLTPRSAVPDEARSGACGVIAGAWRADRHGRMLGDSGASGNAGSAGQGATLRPIGVARHVILLS